MEPVNLFDLAAKQSQWLAVRQSAIAANIANVNTPGYTAVDVEPFEKVLDRTAVSLQATQAGHLGSRGDRCRLHRQAGGRHRVDHAVQEHGGAGETS